jgi:transcription termination factor Rho
LTRDSEAKGAKSRSRSKAKPAPAPTTSKPRSDRSAKARASTTRKRSKPAEAEPIEAQPIEPQPIEPERIEPEGIEPPRGPSDERAEASPATPVSSVAPLTPAAARPVEKSVQSRLFDDRPEPANESLGFGVGLGFAAEEVQPAVTTPVGRLSPQTLAPQSHAPQSPAPVLPFSPARPPQERAPSAAGTAPPPQRTFQREGGPGAASGEPAAGPGGSAEQGTGQKRWLSRRERWKLKREQRKAERIARRAEREAAGPPQSGPHSQGPHSGGPHSGGAHPVGAPLASRPDARPQAPQRDGEDLEALVDEAFDLPQDARADAADSAASPRGEPFVEGLLVVEKSLHGHLRLSINQYLPARDDPHVSPRLVQRYQLREGSLLTCRVGRGQGQHRWEVLHIENVDGKPAAEARATPQFKKLVSVDPDFHYNVGDLSGDVNLRVVDLICPVGRGQRGLIVAPPRTGKTILLQKFALAMQEHFTDVHVMVLLVDERPEEATEWKRIMTRGQVFVSTNDEMPQNHVELAEAVWARCRRLVELGQDVFLVIDSITRLARAYNNTIGGDGRTMSGGIDSRTMERPKQFFGSARNTESAGSLTILGTTLIETGSRMDQVIFEEFKGTGNMELVLSRKLADRRIFPAIDIQKSGTRKDEKLFGARRLHLVNTLRRVLNRMNFIDAMELLAVKLEQFKNNDEFLKRFEVDPEA